MTSVAVIPSAARKGGKLIWAGPLAVAVVAAAGFVAMRSFHGGPAAFVGTFEPSAMRDLDVRITKDGEVQAVNNIDIYSSVEGQTTILTLVKEGTNVKKGDVLITLDASTIKQRIEDTTLDVEKAEADLTTAKEMVEIQKSQNATNQDAADVAVELAKLDLAEYEEGSYKKELADDETAVKMAEITLKNSQENFKQTNDLFQKGFVTAVDVKTAETDLTKAQNGLDQAKLALEVLRKYTYKKESASNQSTLAQSEQKRVRTQRENAANLNQRMADLHSKEQALSLQKRRLDHYKEQLEACTVTAPADGLVVYGSSSDRNSQNPIQEGATVRERQLLLRLPDTSSLKAVVRVQEAQISRIREGQRAVIKVVGLAKPVGGTVSKISVLADSSQRWWNPDLKEYPVDLALDEAPATVKPGVSVTAEVYVNRLPNVLTVPLTAVYASGSAAYVFVRSEPYPLPRKVKLGEVNETHAQVLDGITAGTPVLILQSGQGRDLLEKAGIKEAPTTRPSGALDRKGGGKRGAAAPAAGEDGKGSAAAGGAKPDAAKPDAGKPDAGKPEAGEKKAAGDQRPRGGGRRNRGGDGGGGGAGGGTPG